MATLEQQLKTLIIESLNLEEITPEEIGDDEPLFGEGLGLDSIDALELGMAIKKKYNVTVNGESEQMRGYSPPGSRQSGSARGQTQQA